VNGVRILYKWNVWKSKASVTIIYRCDPLSIRCGEMVGFPFVLLADTDATRPILL
jgi:hypothetical protein